MREVALRSRGKPAGGNAGGWGTDTQRYRAFLSYSHKDSAIADWLHGALEKYRVPRALVGRQTATGTIPSGLAPIFRDRHELAASGDLGHTIREALAASRCLIVLCSPDAAKSRWTNEEILAFKKMRPDGLVLAAITAGEPFASEIPGREAEECFPPALRQKFDRRGRPTAKRAEPIAADLREDKDGRQLGMLKLVAGMLGVGLDDLVQREQQRKQKRLTYIAAASLAGMTLTSGLAVFAFDKRDEARDQRREAEGLVGFMLGDLRAKLEPIGRLDALDAVGSRALQYFEKQDLGELSDDALAQRSRALTLMGEIAQTRGDLDGALRRYREAMASTAEMARRNPDPRRLFDHAQNVFWVGSIDWQRGRIDQAASAFREYQRLALDMISAEPNNPKWRLEQVYAENALGAVYIERARFREASNVFRSALDGSESLVASDPKNPAYQDRMMEALAWLSQSRESEGALDDALALRERQLALAEEQSARNGASPYIQRVMMAAHRATGRLLAQRGDLREGFDHLRRSASLADELLRTEPANTEWTQRRAEVQLELGELELAVGAVDQAGTHARAGCAGTDRLVAKDSSVQDWRLQLQISCLELRARLALARGSTEEAQALSRRAVLLATGKANQTKSLDERFALARAHLLSGQTAKVIGDSNAARHSFNSALAAWPAGVELTPRQLGNHVIILEGAGRRADANNVASRLSAMGFRHPAYLQARRMS